MGEVTALLEAGRENRQLDVRRIFKLLYADLKRIAHARLRYRDDRLLMDTGALVHEAFLRLVDSDPLAASCRGEFLAYAAQAMRSVIVDLVREQQAQRRGGGLQQQVTLDTQGPDGLASAQGGAEILSVHEALEELARIDERLVRVVEMRYFVGLSNDEIAQALGVTTRTVERDWQKARTFLFHSLRSR